MVSLERGRAVVVWRRFSEKWYGSAADNQPVPGPVLSGSTAHRETIGLAVRGGESPYCQSLASSGLCEMHTDAGVIGRDTARSIEWY